MKLGESKRFRPTGGRRAKPRALPARPSVVDEGDELEVVWYPHRDAASLLPSDTPGRADHTIERGRLALASLPRRSFLG
jgi:hypothetical protein